MLLHKGNDLFHGSCRIASYGATVGDVGLVVSTKTPSLNPGIGEIPFSPFAEKHHPADSGHRTPLMLDDQPQRLQVASREHAHRRKRLGSSSEVQRFRVEIRHRLLIIGFAASEAPQFLDQLPVGAAIGRTDSHIDAVQPGTLEMMRASCARIHLHGHDMSAAPRQNLQFRDKTRQNVVAHHAGQAFLHIQRRTHTNHVAGTVFHTNQDDDASRVRKRHNGAQHSIRRRQVALELKCLAFRALQEIKEVHRSEVYYEAAETARLPCHS